MKRPPRPNCQIPAESQRKAIALYEEGHTLAAAASAVGCCRHAVKDAILRSGGKLRTRQEIWSAKRKHPFNESFFSCIDTEPKAYWLGFVSADGCVNTENRSLQVLLAREDRDHLAKLNEAMSGTAQIYDSGYYANGRFYPTSGISFFSTQLMNDLIQLGVVPVKSLIIRPWIGPDHLMPHYWRGVVDGDGCLHRRSNGYWSIGVMGSHWMAQGFLAFVQKTTGASGNIRVVKKNSYATFGGLGLPQLIARTLYGNATVSLDRKQKLAEQLMAVTPKRPFGTQKDHSYLTPQIISDLFSELGTRAAVAQRLGVHMSDIARLRRLADHRQHQAQRE